MRKNYITKAALAMLLLPTVLACEKDLPVWDDETCRLNFYYDIDDRSDYEEKLSQSSYSFVYGSSDLTCDTVWFTIETMGKTSTIDRPITLTQVSTDSIDAVAGKHYVAFDDPSIADFYKIKAGTAQAKIPIVMLRDASLKTDEVTLKIKITPNDYFTNGYPEYQTRTLTFSDHMTKPSNWDKEYPTAYGWSYPFSAYFGEYGQVKHQFLIDHTGKKWDNDYIDELMEGDSQYLQYILTKVVNELAELNAERAAQGLGPLCEADGTEVSFY